MKRVLLISLLFFNQTSHAYDCNSDCHEEASYRYPCPTFRNPGRKCGAKNPVKFALCESSKIVSCELWNGTVAFFIDHVKPMLQDQFNAETYRKAEVSDETAQYMVQCTAAATASCAVVGSQFTGPWGAVIGGAGGAFVSTQICQQSTKW